MMSLSLLKSVEASYSVLAEITNRRSSLELVEKRQGITRGLTHITDKAFQYFMRVEEKRRQFQSLENLAKHRSNILTATVDHLIYDEELHQLWTAAHITPEPVFEMDSLVREHRESLAKRVGKELYKNVLKRFLLVANTGYRKYILDHMCGRKKQLPHRASVQVQSGIEEQRPIQPSATFSHPIQSTETPIRPAKCHKKRRTHTNNQENENIAVIEPPSQTRSCKISRPATFLD